MSSIGFLADIKSTKRAKTNSGYLAEKLKAVDANCITLVLGTSNRLGNFFGTFDNADFSLSLEAHLDKLNIQIKGQTKDIVKLNNRLSVANDEIQNLKNKLFVACAFLCISVVLVTIALITK